MERANKLLCPNCGAALKSACGIRIGRTIQCLKCGAGFMAGSADSEHTTSVSPFRLALVLGAALLYVSAGGALAFYCFTLHSANLDTAQGELLKQSAEEIADESVDPAPPMQQPSVPVSAEQQHKIDNAIANGVWYLKDHAFSAGAGGQGVPGLDLKRDAVGLAMLPALTLLECGVPPGDPVVQMTATFVRQRIVRSDLGCSVYQRSLAILFLDRLGDKKDEEIIRYLALCLIAGQHPTEGAWQYDCPTLDRNRTAQLLKLLKDRRQSLESWRKVALRDNQFDIGGWDNSNTQFAVLALWVAQRHGVPIARTSQLVETHFRRTQLSDIPDPLGKNLTLDGSWFYDYHRNSSGWPSMTCSGLLALAVAHGVADPAMVQKVKPKEDTAIQRGLAMLAREIERPDDSRPHDYYFLWSLERVGVLYNLPKIGGKDWYAWGRKELLAKQQDDGSWRGGTSWGGNNIVDTCFALLFLKQANLAQDLTSKLSLLEKK
jgi:hypothetical protein